MGECRGQGREDDPPQVSEDAVKFSVFGQPVPQGSKRAFGKNVVEVADARLRSWRHDVASVAHTEMNGTQPFTGPVTVQLYFHFARPKGHYGTGRNAERLRPTAPVSPQVKPDLDKLVRAVLDALTGVVFRDDSLVVNLIAGKGYVEYGHRPGLDCTVVQYS